MAKITRYDGNFKAFGSDATGTERTVFGSTTQTDDLTTNLGAEYQRGWGVLPSGQKPPKQYFNGALFGTSQAVAYLHQAGIAEWNGEQEYHAGSITNRNGQIFVCLTDDHVSASAPETDSTNWRLDDGSVATISALLNRTTVGTVNVLNYHTGLEGGGGVFYWDASKPKSEHNGGTVIDPDKAFPTDWNNQTQLTTWFTAGSSGTGCWVRQIENTSDYYLNQYGLDSSHAPTTVKHIFEHIFELVKNVQTSFGGAISSKIYLTGIYNLDGVTLVLPFASEKRNFTYIYGGTKTAFRKIGSGFMFTSTYDNVGELHFKDVLFESLDPSNTVSVFDGNNIIRSSTESCMFRGLYCVWESLPIDGVEVSGYIQSINSVNDKMIAMTGPAFHVGGMYNVVITNLLAENFVGNGQLINQIGGNGYQMMSQVVIRDSIAEGFTSTLPVVSLASTNSMVIDGFYVEQNKGKDFYLSPTGIFRNLSFNNVWSGTQWSPNHTMITWGGSCFGCSATGIQCVTANSHDFTDVSLGAVRISDLYTEMTFREAFTVTSYTDTGTQVTVNAVNDLFAGELVRFRNTDNTQIDNGRSFVVASATPNTVTFDVTGFSAMFTSPAIMVRTLGLKFNPYKHSSTIFIAPFTLTNVDIIQLKYKDKAFSLYEDRLTYTIDSNVIAAGQTYLDIDFPISMFRDDSITVNCTPEANALGITYRGYTIVNDRRTIRLHFSNTETSAKNVLTYIVNNKPFEHATATG